MRTTILAVALTWLVSGFAHQTAAVAACNESFAQDLEIAREDLWRQKDLLGVRLGGPLVSDETARRIASRAVSGSNSSMQQDDIISLTHLALSQLSLMMVTALPKKANNGFMVILKRNGETYFEWRKKKNTIASGNESVEYLLRGIFQHYFREEFPELIRAIVAEFSVAKEGFANFLKVRDRNDYSWADDAVAVYEYVRE